MYLNGESAYDLKTGQVNSNLWDSDNWSVHGWYWGCETGDYYVFARKVSFISTCSKLIIF